MPGQHTLPEVTYTATSEKAARLLGFHNRLIEEAFVLLVRQLLEIE